MHDYTDTQYEDAPVQAAAYNGSKAFTQQQVLTANATGFGAATDDYAERGIDLNEQLIKNKTATFFFKMQGQAMQGMGIAHGSTLIVDRSITATNGRIVVVTLYGEMLVRKLVKTADRLQLVGYAQQPIITEVPANAPCSVWGVVTYAIQAL